MSGYVKKLHPTGDLRETEKLAKEQNKDVCFGSSRFAPSGAVFFGLRSENFSLKCQSTSTIDPPHHRKLIDNRDQWSHCGGYRRDGHVVIGASRMRAEVQPRVEAVLCERSKRNGQVRSHSVGLHRGEIV